MLFSQKLTLTLILLNFKFIYSIRKCQDFCGDLTNNDPKQPINCFCSHCQYYNDCCKDMFTKPTKPVDSVHSGECNIRINKILYAHSIDKCALWWNQGEEVKNMCEQSGSHLFNSIPVYSNQSKLTYRNVYCAKCNIKSFDPESIKFFEIQTSTSELLEESNKEEQLTELALLDLMNNYKSNNYSYKTWIEFLNPKENENLRYCIKSIDSCPIGSSKEDIDLCNEETAYRYKFGTVYKNLGCARCNGEKDNELMCANYEPREFRHQSLQLLFDLSNLYGEIVINLNIKLKINDGYVSTKRIECNFINQNLTSLNQIVCDNNNVFNLTLNININTDVQCDPIDNENVDEDNMGNWIKKYMTICGQLISIISLILLLFMYFSNKVLRNLPGKLLICLSISLLLSQILFLLSTYITKPYIYYILNNTNNNTNNNCKNNLINKFDSISILLDSILKSKSLDCYILGMLTHYFYLAFFTWSNIMAYDLYKMFIILSNKKLSKNSNKSVASTCEDDNKKRFIKYLIIGWSIPLVLILVLLAHQFVNRSMAYSFKSCFISNQVDLLFFFILPVLIILLTNIYYLFYSINSIRSVDKMSKKYLKHDYDEDFKNATTSMIVNVPSSVESPPIQPVSNTKSKSKFIKFSDTIKKKINKKSTDSGNNQGTNDKKRLILFLKLFILTGMTWIVGIFTSFMKNSFIWYVYIVLNSLQGLFIFCAYAFNPQTKKHVSKTRLYKRLSSFFSTSETNSKIKLNSSDYRKSTSSSIETKKI